MERDRNMESAKLNIKFKKIVFLLPTASWFTLFQRPHHFARLFKREGLEVIAVDKNSIVGTFKEVINKPVFRQYAMVTNHRYSITLPPVPLLTDTKRCLFNVYKNYYNRSIRRLFGKVFSDDAIVWLHGFSELLEPQVIDEMPRKLLILDVCDDFPFFRPEIYSELLELEQELARRADFVFTTAENLYKRLIPLNKKTFYIPNAVDEHIIESSRLPYSRPHDIPVGAPIVGYHGYIAEWLDYNLIANIIRQLKNVNFVFIGRLSLSSRDLALFKQVLTSPNVYFLGEKPPSSLPVYISYFDVGIIPFSITPLTISTNPIKLYEYLALGKPVVSTNLPEIRRYEEKGIVIIAKDMQSFVEAIWESISYSSNNEMSRRRIQVARENTWNTRFKRIKHILLKELAT